ncbi:Hypothetical predicted protein [Olea europaea subsp. europaea]|uniref:Uncharacterized protein n=1 Tax=Olea europaea subsp. europaea TaxID=158383 RepID=A0A8S0PVM0_OLEEU|nr:Hypothetical predicted protein [Olea europaea subsp. europaea]
MDGAYNALCPDEEELLVGTEHLPDEVYIVPRPDDDHEPLPTPIDDPQDGAAMELSHAVEVNDAEFDGCNVTNGEGVLSLTYLFLPLYQKQEAEFLRRDGAPRDCDVPLLLRRLHTREEWEGGRE